MEYTVLYVECWREIVGLEWAPRTSYLCKTNAPERRETTLLERGENLIGLVALLVEQVLADVVEQQVHQQHQTVTLCVQMDFFPYKVNSAQGRQKAFMLEFRIDNRIDVLRDSICV